MIMTFDGSYKILRELANTSYYQTLFIREDLQVFKNNTDLSDIQVMFLSLLGFYHTLNMDCFSGEVDDTVYKDFIYEDSYMYWKTHKDTKDRERNIKERYQNKQRPMGLQKEKITSKKSQWLFK